MRKRSQIATILTLIIALVFLFMVITINMGKVSKKKTVISNACDGAGLLLASGLGSVTTSLRFELGIFGDSPVLLAPNTSVICAWGVILVGLLTGIFTGFTTTLVALTMAGSLMFFANEALFQYYTAPNILREMQAKSQNMTAEQRLLEGAIQYMIFTTLDDPKFVPDLYDVNRNGIKMQWDAPHTTLTSLLNGVPTPGVMDKITRFNHWYFQRLNSLPRLGELIDRFYAYLFPDPPGPGNLGRQFEIIENPRTWNADEAHLLVNGQWRIGDWLRDNLKPFVNQLWEHGYGVRFANDYTTDIHFENDDLGELYRDIRKFEDFIRGSIYGQSKDERIAGFEVWFSEFYNGSPTDEDWYRQMNEWIQFVDPWIIQLTERHNQVLDCVRLCWAPGPWICGPGGGECCKSHCECCGEDCDCCCVCDSWCGCNPAGRYNCELCASGHCKPTVQCNTPCNPPWCRSRMRNCCESGCFFFIPLCGNLIRSTSGGGGPCDSPCEDEYYDCGSANDTIIRRDYITKLREFQSSIRAFQDRIMEIYNEKEQLKNDPWVRQAIYVWRDITGRETGQYVTPPMQPQNAVHMVYVKLDFPADYKFPYPKFDRRWYSPVIITSVEHGQGDFYIEAGRYDEDLAKQGPLSNFWRFRFRRNPAQDEADLTALRAAATRFSDRLDFGESCANRYQCQGGTCQYIDTCFNELVSPAEFNQLSRFVDANGIVARVRVHYGPGYTYRRDQIAQGRVEASQKNKDIYIMERVR